MGLFDVLKLGSPGQKAFRLHVQAMDLRRKGQYREAEDKMAEAFPLYAEAYKNGERKFNILDGYALLLMRRGDFELAREVMLEANKDKQLRPEDRQKLREDFAMCQWKMGRIDKAVETMERAASGVKSGAVYNRMGVLLLEQAKQSGDLSRATAWMEEAMEYDDDDPETLDNMGQLCLLMADQAEREGDAEAAEQKREEAMAHFRKAWENKPEQITSAYYLAKMFHEKGDDVRARKVIATVQDIPTTAMIQIDPKDLEALKKVLA